MAASKVYSQLQPRALFVLFDGLVNFILKLQIQAILQNASRDLVDTGLILSNSVYGSHKSLESASLPLSWVNVLSYTASLHELINLAD